MTKILELLFLCYLIFYELFRVVTLERALLDCFDFTIITLTPCYYLYLLS